MRKTIVLLLGVMALVGSSCNNEKTYAQKLEEERKAIKDFIEARNFVVKDVPPDSVFLKTEDGRPVFYKMNGLTTTSEAVYVHVIDSGDRVTRVKAGSKVSLRVTNGLNIITNSIQYENSFGGLPFEFMYRTYNNGGCEGWIIPLQFLFQDASVSLIVPSKLGLLNERQYAIQPIYYEKVKYTSLDVD